MRSSEWVTHSHCSRTLHDEPMWPRDSYFQGFGLYCFFLEGWRVVMMRLHKQNNRSTEELQTWHKDISIPRETLCTLYILLYAFEIVRKLIVLTKHLASLWMQHLIEDRWNEPIDIYNVIVAVRFHFHEMLCSNNNATGNGSSNLR